MEIPLDLSKHCIHTEIKKLYSKSIGKCFRENIEIDEMEDRIEMLREALETLDFGGLRSEYTELGGGDSISRVSLYKNPAGMISIKLNGSDIVF
ncbi:hypothetical protein [Desulforegula conservatrix]|uniref:hypothetical protein n=1 Tax=Desulforegula conservatrix TaxID=153026 RepID=UPI0003F7B3B1|nr:hypothetical protein [Desulforegula conservatrix]